MKHIKTRITCLFLAITLVLGGTPAIASAEQKRIPLEGDFYQAADIANKKVSKALSLQYGTPPTDEEIASAPHFETSEQAGVYLREQMKLHSERVVMNVPSSGTINTTVGDARYIAKVAVAHTKVGTEGDYLSYLQTSRKGSGVRKGDIYSYAFTIQWRTTVEQELELDGLIQALEQGMEWGKTGEKEQDIIVPIYEYIMKEMVYDEESYQKGQNNAEDESSMLSHSAYAAMTKKTAVCSAFSMLMYRMLLNKGVDCRILSSDTHAWNAVKCAGKWYECDVTAELQKSIRNPKRLLLSKKSMESINKVYRYNDSLLYDKDLIDAYPWADSDWYSFANMTIRGFKRIITYASSNKKGKQSVTIIDNNGVKLVKGKDFKLSYDGEAVGDKSLKIIGIGEYAGMELSKDYTVKLATPKIIKVERIVSKNKKQTRFKVFFTKVYGAEGYRLFMCGGLNKAKLSKNDCIVPWSNLMVKNSKKNYMYTGWLNVDPGRELDYRTAPMDFIVMAGRFHPNSGNVIVYDGTTTVFSKTCRLPKKKTAKRF